MEINPQTLFERMFGDGSSPEMRKMRRERQASILDSVNGSLRDILGAEFRMADPDAARAVRR